MFHFFLAVPYEQDFVSPALENEKWLAANKGIPAQSVRSHATVQEKTMGMVFEKVENLRCGKRSGYLFDQWLPSHSVSDYTT